MDKVREQIIKLVMGGGLFETIANNIMSIPLELTVECSRCEGKGYALYSISSTSFCKENQYACPACNGHGKNRYRFEIEGKPDDFIGDGEAVKRFISVYDLRDADVAMAYCEIHENFRLDHEQDEEINNNKGTLRAVKVSE